MNLLAIDCEVSILATKVQRSRPTLISSNLEVINQEHLLEDIAIVLGLIAHLFVYFP